MSAEGESFLTRWSRRKRAAESAKEQPAGNVVAEAPAPQPVRDASKPDAQPNLVSASEASPDTSAVSDRPLPPIESLDGLRSDYQAFFQQPVAEDIRHAALKKLFADPHFNQMDMLDVYVDDYTQFEPLPAAMRVRLPSARSFLLDPERAALEATEAPSTAVSPPAGTANLTVDQEGATAASPDAAGVEPDAGLDGGSAGSTSGSTAGPDTQPARPPKQETSGDAVSSPTNPGHPSST